MTLKWSQLTSNSQGCWCYDPSWFRRTNVKNCGVLGACEGKTNKQTHKKMTVGVIGRRPAGEASSCDLDHQPIPVHLGTLESNHSFANDSVKYSLSGAWCPEPASHTSVLNKFFSLTCWKNILKPKLYMIGIWSPVALSCWSEKPDPILP